MYISLLLIISVSVTLDTVDINQILECLCPRADVVKVVPEEIYIAMIDSLRQLFYPRMRQAGRDRKISDSHRKDSSCPMFKK